MQKRAVQFAKKPYLPLFSSETADKFARDYTIEKSFRHALHLVTAHLHCQNQVAHALRTRDFWLASLSMHFPIHFTRRAHEYPLTLISMQFILVLRFKLTDCMHFLQVYKDLLYTSSMLTLHSLYNEILEHTGHGHNYVATCTHTNMRASSIAVLPTISVRLEVALTVVELGVGAPTTA